MRYRATLIGTALIMLLAFCLAGWGWIAGDGLHWDKPDQGAALIGGGIVFFLSALFLSSAVSTYRRASSVRANPEGNFFVPRDAVAAFFEVDREQEEPNEWRPAFGEKRNGVEVSWAGDTLLVGGRLLGFAPEHYPSVYAVELHVRPVPQVIIRYRQFWFNALKSHSDFENTRRTFRFPVTDERAARAMVRHLNGILDAGPTERTRRNSRRVRIVFATAGVLFIVVGGAIFGLALHAQAQGYRLSETERAIAIAATVFAIMGGPLCLGVAWIFRGK
jgi:hypothetical protein